MYTPCVCMSLCPEGKSSSDFSSSDYNDFNEFNDSASSKRPCCLVSEVMPAVEKNREGLMQVIAKITEQCDAKKAKLDDLQVRYKIRVKGEEGPEETEPETAGSSQGVLA